MNIARIVVLTIALSAGGVAAYLASGSDNNKPAPVESAAKLQTAEVLVAKSDIGLGQTVGPDNIQWETWPAGTASNNFIRRNERPEATSQIAGSIARVPFIAGEPIREAKLVKLSDLPHTLPSQTATVNAAARSKQIADRVASYERRTAN